MNTNLKRFAISCCFFGATFQLHSQGYIVPNGVIPVGQNQIDVMHDPANSYYTGFFLFPRGSNTFSFNSIVDIGVRVFFVSQNDPITADAILSGNYSELSYPNNYIFNDGSVFYVGLYTGNQSFAPPNGLYSDPLFGWAKLENIGGTIQLLNSALEYKGGGIYAGTQTIIPVPEPSAFALGALGALLLGFRRWKKDDALFSLV